MYVVVAGVGTHHLPVCLGLQSNILLSLRLLLYLCESFQNVGMCVFVCKSVCTLSQVEREVLQGIQ